LAEEKKKLIEELQLTQYRIHTLLLQKQNFELKLREIEKAMEELKKSQGKTYKIIGPVMVEREKEKLLKDLEETKEIIEIRIKAFEKEIGSLQKRMENLQKRIMRSG